MQFVTTSVITYVEIIYNICSKGLKNFTTNFIIINFKFSPLGSNFSQLNPVQHLIKIFL